MKPSEDLQPNDQNEVAIMVFGFVALIGGAILAFFILRWLILGALDLLEPQAFTSFFGKVFVSIVVFGVGYFAFDLKMKHRQVFAVLQICFALAVNWVALAKFGTEFESDTRPSTQETVPADSSGVPNGDAPAASDTSQSHQPSSWWRLLKITVIWQCLFLVSNGFSTLLEKGREAALKNVMRVGERVDQLVIEHGG